MTCPRPNWKISSASPQRSCAHRATEGYVFGSFTLGRVEAGSDLDVAVRGLASERLFAAAGEATLAVGRIVDVLDLDAATPFVTDLRDSGALRRVA